MKISENKISENKIELKTIKKTEYVRKNENFRKK